MREQALIVYGPQGCGKSRRADELARLYGLPRVTENWDGRSAIPPGCLVLTNVEPAAFNVRVADGVVSMSFDQAMQVLESTRSVA